MTKGILDKLRRKKQEPEPRYRRPGEIAIDISGLSPEGQRTILKAFAEEEKESSCTINMLHPSSDVPTRTLERLWGNPEDIKFDPDKFVESLPEDKKYGKARPPVG